MSFVRDADDDERVKHTGEGLAKLGSRRTVLLESHPPPELEGILNVAAPSLGEGSAGLLKAIQRTLHYSVNTWDRGFLDKLYASTDAPGLAAELVLATLNTNLHVYAVSPALTVIEKSMARMLAGLFGLRGEHSGGVSMQGGAASNLTSMLIARNTMFPIVKAYGMAALPRPLVLFTSAESHFSVSSAAVSLGLGANSIRSIVVDGVGAMDASALESSVQEAIAAGHEPFYVSATAGTTVRGAYDPLVAIGEVCQKYKLWLHIDAAWGGSAILSQKHRWKLEGSDLADSITFNPHKMMGVPVTCSFLLGKDLRKFYASNSLSAGYLFHGDPEDTASAPEASSQLPPASSIYDLASLTPQCGRKGDSLKLYLSWIYHGSDGYEKQIDAAFAASEYMAKEILKRKDMRLVSEISPPCCQCCFYYRGKSLDDNAGDVLVEKRVNSRITRRIVAGLVRKGWMIDYAPGDRGEFLRAVVNRGTTTAVVDGLLKAIVEVGKQVVAEEILVHKQ